MTVKKLLFVALAIGFLASCQKSDEKVAREASEMIEEYIAANNLDAQVTPEGLYYVIDNEGTGQRPTPSSDVRVRYRGELLDGTIFDTNQGRSVSDIPYFSLLRVIPGWTLGIPLFKEGGSGLLIIPPSLGYGRNPPPGNVIGVNEILVFEVNLLDVQ